MKTDFFHALGAYKWWCVWVAYWRLWVVQIRLKLKHRLNQQQWLNLKLHYANNLRTAQSSEIVSNNLVQQDGLLHAMRVHESVRLAARLHFVEQACLPKSIVLADMLNAQGAQAQVMLGVSKQNGQFRSHAWVEIEGQMVSEPENVLQDFKPVNL